jgi:putative nucleotidyltransferase with HDIG domain
MFYFIRKSYVIFKKRIRGIKKRLVSMNKFNSWMIGIFFYIGTLWVVLKSMNLLQPSGDTIFKMLGVAFCVFLFLLIALFYLHRYNVTVIQHPSKFFLLCLINFGAILVAHGILSSQISDYLIPAALIGILLASLLEGHGALTCIVVLGGLLGFISKFSIDVVFVFVIVGGVASLGISFTHRRIDLLKIGTLSGIIGAVFIAGWGWLYEWNPQDIVTQSLYGMGSGLISAVLALGILPLLENLFGILTDAKLFELSHLTHPLLVKLREKAPGSYQSSLMVANLAEAAAEKINANPLLARVGAYYHDIGKIKNPSYFVENVKMNSKSKHEKMNPALSSLILTSHVKEGIQLASKYRLPKAIQDIVSQHHGTTFTSFFYQEALKKDSHNSVKEEDFRYSGPKPQSKEAAIVMLADTVEAASRTLENPSPARIKSLVEKLVREKLMAKQLDESELTLKDLNIIQENFIHTLTGTFHSRIEYPPTPTHASGEKENEDKHPTARERKRGSPKI